MGMSQNTLAVTNASKKWCPCIIIFYLSIIQNIVCLFVICTIEVRSLVDLEEVRGSLNPWASQSGPVVNKVSCSITELLR